MFPNLCQTIAKVTIPKEHKPDCLVWNTTISGNLSLKEAYSFKCHHAAQDYLVQGLICPGR
ncbi:hypothetical protein L195_g015968 [Trifolium pratense]|uniref:Uncharacterized protein n=1 Tax=Trifolium pratense TaxID=57577 RepID=A0A2K3MPY2_TRIPR|nr:hypothetical protein L195_g015968 [Trifolium pratense]